MTGRALLRPALLAGIAAAAPTFGQAPTSRYDDPQTCSRLLASGEGASLPTAAHRLCVIAIASTYIDAEENSIPPERQLLADDVSRHMVGKQADFKAGNARKIIADNSHAVIGAIKNRQWVVDGNQAWILYDGYLKSDPSKPGFNVAERLTIEHGLIKEILVAAVARPQ